MKPLRVSAFGTTLFVKLRQRKKEEFGITGELLSCEAAGQQLIDPRAGQP
jgi:hypothetical protein